MQAKLATAALCAFVLLTAAACGGGSDTTKITELEADLAAAEEARKAAEAEAAEAERKRLEEEVARLKAEKDAADADKKREKAEEDAEKAEADKEEAKDDVTEAQRRAREQIERQAQTLVANQRAEKLLEALEADLSSDPESARVDISVPTKNKLTFKQPDYTSRSISAPGLRGAKLARSRGASLTTVIYTDIELSRKLVDHYDSTKSEDNPGQFTLPASVLASSTNFIARSASSVPISQRLSITHGLSSSITTDDPRETMNDKATFSGRVHGVSGTFVCEGDACMLRATGAYNAANAESNANKLNSVTLEATSGTLYFKPSGTGSVSLCADTSQCLEGDMAYMAFGWWRSEPANAQGGYEFEPFVAGMSLVSAVPAGVKAEYNGVAVGMYVEQDQVGTAAVTKKQGEFTADARLDYNASDGLTGTIDTFKATPTGGSGTPATVGTWAVELEGSNSAVLQRRGGAGEGNWYHRYVSDGSAVVGIFESGIEDVLHIKGAFGAR